MSPEACPGGKKKAGRLYRMHGRRQETITDLYPNARTAAMSAFHCSSRLSRKGGRGLGDAASRQFTAESRAPYRGGWRFPAKLVDGASIFLLETAGTTNYKLERLTGCCFFVCALRVCAAYIHATRISAGRDI